MKLTKSEIVEYIVTFVGIVVVLAYIYATAEPRQMVGAAQASPMTIDAGWTPRADAGRSTLRLRNVTYTDMQV